VAQWRQVVGRRRFLRSGDLAFSGTILAKGFSRLA